MAHGDGLIIGGMIAAGVTAGLAAYLLTHKPTVSCTSDAECPAGEVCVNGTCLPSATCSCASPDVCPTNGVCPSGYESDPANPGCCKPTSTSSSLIWSIGGSTGPIAVSCTGVCVTASDVTVTGLTPNGPFTFYAANNPANLGTINSDCECLGSPGCPPGDAGLFCPITPSCGNQCPPPGSYTADAFGNFSAVWYEASFCCAICFSTDNGACFLPPGTGTTTYYLAVLDQTTNTLSNVITINIPAYPVNSADCGCITNA